jgi:mannosyltransferase OCH1-like enzyme
MIVINRLSKVLGVFVKGFSYVFHFLFPNKRFTIPFRSQAIIKPYKYTKIPKIIWQTNYTNKVTLPIYINYLFNRLLSLDYEYRYVSTEGRLEFLEKYADQEIVESYKQLTNGASQADFWRVFVLYKYGGIYMDIDAHIVWPLSRLLKEDKELFILTRKGTYNNYFIATMPQNKVFKDALDIIVDNIKNKNIEGGVYSLTGPVVFNRAIGDKKVNCRIYKIVSIQGSWTNEYFQYIDKPRSKWTYAKNSDLLKNNNA